MRRLVKGLVLLVLMVAIFDQSLATLKTPVYAWPPYRTAIGPQSVIVITVDFPDTRGTFSTEYVRDLIFKKTDEYFREVSYDETRIAGNVTRRWYELPQNSTFYEWKKATPEGSWDYFQGFVNTVVRLADDEVDFSKYPFVAIAHSGNWRLSFGFVDPFKISTKEGTFTVNVPLISLYAQDSVFAHELAHVFGNLPDMYDEHYTASFVGPWDLMSDSSRYVHFSAWSKMKMGWIQPSAVVTAPRGRMTNATIDPLESSTSQMYALKIPLTQNTYYLAEVRQNTGSDMGLPDHGLLIYFVDESKNNWGQSPLIVQDSNPSTTTFNDAAFDLCDGKQAAFFDKKNDASIVITGKRGLSYSVSAGPVNQEEIVLAQTVNRHNESCYYAQPFKDDIGDLFDKSGLPTKAEPYLDLVSTDIKRSGDSYLIELNVDGAMPERIDPSLWIEWDIAVDTDNNPNTGWTWWYNDIGVDYIIRVGILDAKYYPQVMKTQPTFHEIAKPVCQITGSKILFAVTAAEFQMPSNLVWMVTAQKWGNRGESSNAPLLASDKAPNSRHYMTPIESIRSATETTTATYVSTVSETTAQTGTTPLSPGLGSIPGFPAESILAGLVSGAIILLVLRRRGRT
jgi:hypothetical protein